MNREQHNNGYQTSKSVPYVQWRTVRFGHGDPAGVVYTPRYADFCLEAIETWLNDYIGLNWADIVADEGMMTPFVHMEFDFLASVRPNDELGIVVHIENIGRSSLALMLEGVRSARDGTKEQAFTSKFVICYTDSDSGAIPLPDRYRIRLENYLNKSMQSNQEDLSQV